MNTEHTNGLEERLWNYIDGLSDGQERSAIEQLLQTNVEWQSKYRELLDVHQLLHSTDLEEPSMRFTRNVMEEIAKYQIAPATKSYINKKIIYGIGGFFALMLIGLLVYGLGQIDWSASGSTNMPVDFGKVDYSPLLNNTYVNVFMMINVVLGLMLLDRYLTKKKNENRNLSH